MGSAIAATSRRLRRALLLLLALTAAGTISCAHTKQGAAAGSEEESPPVLPEFVFVAVENHDWSDVVVSLVSNDGRITRIGNVPGSTNTVLRFPGRLMASGPTLQLVARAVGGGPTEIRSEKFVVMTGQQVTWTLEKSLRRASLAVF